MGFGILLIGYLVTFVIWMTVQALNIGSLALLLGYGLMLYGLSRLNLYHTAFAFARAVAAVQLLPTLWFLAKDASVLFSFSLDTGVWGHVHSAVLGASFALEIVFLLSMLYAIRALAVSVGLKVMAVSVVRNMIFVSVHALLTLVTELPFLAALKPYLATSRFLVELVTIISVALLLLSCAKNICPAGDEEVSPRESRFAWVNKMSNAYEQAQKRLNEQSRADGEAFMRRQREKKEQKNQKKKK